MNWVDIVIIVILGLSVITGFINGFVKEVASLVALILGIWVAIRFSSFTAIKLEEWFDITGSLSGIVSFIVTFLVIVVLIHLIGNIIDKTMKALSLGILNKTMGALFSLIKSVLIMSVCFVVLNTINEHKTILPSKVNESLLYDSISDIAPAIFPTIGEGDFVQSFDRIKKKQGGTII